ncbi:MAG: CPBP family intramembrane metalloprotease, partial [Polyangiaceae bacterium]|nr:CPBP family intramembrane metalloprotease [Polyangiaceae bacterium]
MRPLHAAFVAAAVFGIALTSYFAFRPESAGTLAFWVLGAGPSLVLAGLGAAWARREELLREWLTPQWGDFTSGALGAALFFALAWGFSRLFLPVGSPREIWLVSLYGEIGDPRLLQTHAPAIAATIGASAVAEEVLWRGVITRMVAERVGSRSAWLWAAVLYSLAYLPTAWSLRAMTRGAAGLDPILPIAALGGGLLWGGMARASGRLVPGIVAHALFDW